MKTILILPIIFLLALQLCAQTTPTEHPGILLYKQGKYDDAIRSLSVAVKQKDTKADASIWNYLGLAYFETNDYKKALKALKKAVDIDPNNSSYRDNVAFTYLMQGQTSEALKETDKAIQANPTDAAAYYIRGNANLRMGRLDDAEQNSEKIISFNAADPKGYLLSSNVILARLSIAASKNSDPNGGPFDALKDNLSYLKQAHDVLERGVGLSKGVPGVEALNSKLESVNAFLEHFSKLPKKPNDPPEEGVTPVKIIEKPKATYTDLARNRNIQGVVRLAVLLGADATVKQILLLRSLGYGLDEQSIAAARRIKFEPKLKDGKPVATVVIIDYGFNIY